MRNIIRLTCYWRKTIDEMKQFTQDGNVYEFPDDWLVVPAYDELPFFKHPGGNQAIMAKGCDIVAVCGDELWLIEAKDYDRKSMKETRPKSTELATTIARKGFDTLAGLQVGSRYQPNPEVADICRQAVNCKKVIVCATIEPSTAISSNHYDRQFLHQIREQLKRNTAGYADKVYVTQNRDEKAWKKWSSHKDPSSR